MNEKTFVGSLLVSTVRLPIDHGFDGTPLWYETMVFPDETGRQALYCDRYTTEEEALAGHLAIVARLEAGELLDGLP